MEASKVCRKAPVGGAATQEKETSMSYQPSHETPDILDDFLLDDAFDDALDRELFAIRESLADDRND
jgi:hypothetical protein